VPSADGLITATNNFFPVGAATTFRNISSYLKHTHSVVSTESVIVHHDNVEVHFIGVHVENTELKGLIENGT